MIVNVATIAPLDTAYSYSAPDDIEMGAYVRVPFGRQKIWGVVWGEGQDEGKKLKEIAEIALVPPMTALQRDFIDRMAAYTMSPRGLIVKMALSGASGFQTLKRGPRKTKEKYYEFLEGPELTEAQSGAVADIRKSMGKAKPVLLDGVTGSGKTETYLEAVWDVLKQKRQVLVLVPEIALTGSVIERFKARFGEAPAIWHSNLTPVQRRNIWHAIGTGEEMLVIGARSALFLPWQNLGLIIVDEEHDPAYKQEDSPFYNARDMAVLRAHLGEIPIVLASATPSLETMHNVWQNKYDHVELPQRFGGAKPPHLHVVDMRTEKQDARHFIGPTLRAAVSQALDTGEQSLLYLNRRGYAPLTLCRACGEKIECPHCSSWLVEHRAKKILQCHHCDYTIPIPEECPVCAAKDSLVPCGPGVERVAEEVKEAWPHARVSVMASDTTSDLRHLHDILRGMHEHSIDILIGTQMIAKGHHFPQLTCVGVVDADLGLSGGDLRAAERTYQLLTQVAGRAGREQKPGHVWLQSYKPEARVMQALLSNDRDAFLQIEANEREISRMPPYTRLIGIIVKSKHHDRAEKTARALAQIAPDVEGVDVWGPAAAPLAKIRDEWRFRLLVAAEKSVNVQPLLRLWLEAVKKPPSVDIILDVDPQSFY